MKMKYQYPLGLLFLFAVAFFSIQAERGVKEQTPIIYSIYGGEDINAELKRGMAQYKDLFPKLQLENTDFYITIGECKNQVTVILGHCKGCALKTLVGATNRYLEVDKTLKLPIIYESDKLHATFFADPTDGARIFISSEGYMIVADENRNIISKGFTQY